jgi:hypothetical protein
MRSLKPINRKPINHKPISRSITAGDEDEAS